MDARPRPSQAEVVGANAQGWVRAFGPGGEVAPCEWERPDESLAGVHALFLSEHDIPGALRRSHDLLSFVPMIAVTSGWRGLSLVTREGIEQVPGFPRTEVDPTGAGDVFADCVPHPLPGDGQPVGGRGVRLLRRVLRGGGRGHHDAGRPGRDHAPVEQRDRLIEDGEWEE